MVSRAFLKSVEFIIALCAGFGVFRLLCIVFVGVVGFETVLGKFYENGFLLNSVCLGIQMDYEEVSLLV